MIIRLTTDLLRRIIYNGSHHEIDKTDENISKFVCGFNWYADDYELSNHLNMSAFLAQVLCETGNLAHMEENLNYSASRLLQVWPRRFTPDLAERLAGNPEKIANYVYANRMGNQQTGDGWKYRGRGCIMLTGRLNYDIFMKYAKAKYQMDIQPDDLSKFPAALLSAMWFWNYNNLNILAQRGMINAITTKVTGGSPSLQRYKYYNRIRQILDAYEN